MVFAGPDIGEWLAVLID